MHSVVPTKGVKFKYVIGEKVLCYEPDPAKAKVLYESTVLDLVTGQEGNGRRRPEYLVHFFGWNSSWDRCVGEDWVLPMTDENRELQRRLAEEAAIYLKGCSRLPPLFKPSLAKNNKPVEKPASDPDSSDSSEDEKEVIINIPAALKLMLEEDCRCITKKNKLVAIPCYPNVVTILESFVKHSAAKMFCESPPRNGKHFVPDDVQDKLGLYKETADGLRVSFDFTLPHLLLYGQEKKQHYSHCSTARPHRGHHEIVPTSLKVEPPSSDPEYPPSGDWEPVVIKQEPASPKSVPKRGRPRLRRNIPKKAPTKTKPVANSSPAVQSNVNTKKVKASKALVAKTSKNRGCKSVAKKNSAGNATANLKTQMIEKRRKGRPKSLPTRILRSSHMPIRSRRLPVKRQPAASIKTSTKRNRIKMPLPIAIKTEPSLCEDRITRHGSVQARIALENHIAVKNNFCSPEAFHLPIERPLPSPCSLVNSCSTVKVGSSGSSDTVRGIHRLKRLLKDALGWRMLPEQVWEIVPAQPSLIYGAQHLLRLFVKLPDLISKMRISNRKLQLLLNIINQFLAYMLEQKDQLFPSSAYVDCPSDK